MPYPFANGPRGGDRGLSGHDHGAKSTRSRLSRREKPMPLAITNTRRIFRTARWCRCRSGSAPRQMTKGMYDKIRISSALDGSALASLAPRGRIWTSSSPRNTCGSTPCPAKSRRPLGLNTRSPCCGRTAGRGGSQLMHRIFATTGRKVFVSRNRSITLKLVEDASQELSHGGGHRGDADDRLCPSACTRLGAGFRAAL